MDDPVRTPPTITFRPIHPHFWKVGAVYRWVAYTSGIVRTVRVIDNDGALVRVREMRTAPK